MNTNSNLKKHRHRWQLIAIFLSTVIAGSSVFVYTTTIASNARSQQQLVSVYLAQSPIPMGTSLGSSLQSGLIQLKQLPAGSRPADSILNINSANNALMAKQSIQPGQIITTALFATKAANTGALDIPEGMLAVTVPMTDPAKVAGFLQPGSQVAIFVTGSFQSGNSESTQVLLPQTTVLAIGDQVTTSGQGTNNASLVTLALTPIQAKKIIYAAQNLTLYFGLRTDDIEVNANSAISNSNLFSAKN